ncbi:MAG TPA: HisA/HisF-related TIM barrel protein, partial [Longimicrobiaceae bacterium]|nr:HisA/HisF-related TIM barrel protein [Longimicrobiaceae bacterium]
MSTTVNDSARTPRIVACLDLQGGRVVKGTEFVDLQDQGDPLALAARAEATGADEVVLLDIAGTRGAERAAFLEVVRRAARTLSVPVVVGGGVRSVEDAERALDAGAVRVAVNS